MSHRLFDLEVRWDGHRLIAIPSYGDGWRVLLGTPGSYPLRYEVPCYEATDLTAFELGLFLSNALRQFTYNWEHEEPTQLSPWLGEQTGTPPK